MKKRHFELLLDQLELQYYFANSSFNKFNNLYHEIKEKNAKPTAIIKVNEIEFWLSLREFVTSLANIAKILVLPTENENLNKNYSRKMDQKRRGRDVLIQEIGLVGNLPVISDKLLRNSLEHIDERIDDYDKPGIKLTNNRSIIPNFFRGSKAIVQIDDSIEKFDKTDYKENIFYEEKEIYYAAFGDDVPIIEAAKELGLLGEKIREVKDKLEKGELDSKFNY